jgi:predicted nucleotidyltransferase
MLNLRSVISKKILGYFFLHEEKELYLNEMCRRFNLDRGNLVKKLRELEAEGVLKSEWKGNQRYYHLNPSFPLIKEYKKIILKTIGIEQTLKSLLKKIKGVEKAFLFGSYAQNKMDSLSDLDLIVIGEHNTIALNREIAQLQKEIDREINVISIDSDEFEAKRKKDPFFQRILKKEKIELV